MSADVQAAESAAPEPMPVTIVEQVKPDLDADLGATWDKIAGEAGDDGDNDNDSGDGAEEGPARGPDGKFAKRDGEDGEEGEDAPEQEAAEGETEAEVNAIEPPETWPEELREKFAALPPDVAEYVATTAREHNEALSKVGDQLVDLEKNIIQFVEPFDRIVREHRADFERRGIEPARAFETLLQAQAMLDQNPLGGLVQIGRTYGFDLLPVLQAHGIQVQQPQQAYQQQQVQPYVAALESKLQQLEGKMSAQERAIYDAEEQRLNATITDFSKDKPYFDEVRQVMAALLQGEQAKDLATAYEMAIHASPAVRQRIQQDQRKAEAAKRTVEQKAKATDARKSTAVNVKSGTPSAANHRTQDDTLNEIARRHYG